MMNGNKMYFAMIGMPVNKRLAVITLAMLICFSAGTAGAFDMDIMGSKVTLGGFAKLTFNYDFDGSLNNNTNHPTDADIINAYDSPLDGTAYDDESDFSMSARESRLFLKTATDTELGQMITYIEADFSSDVGGSPTSSNSRVFRMRHAYGVLNMGSNSILVGQTWTSMMDFAAAVPVTDLSGDPGMIYVRQPQIRFQHNFDKGHYFSVAFENPARGLVTNGNGSLIRNSETTTADNMPDIIAKYFWGVKNFHISPAVLVRRFELNDDSTIGWGAALTSHIGFGNGHKIYAGVIGGEGIGRYAGLGLNTGFGLTDSGDVETVGLIGYNTGCTLKLRKDIAWTLGCGYMENDEDAYEGEDAVLSGNAVKNAFSWHTNMIWDVTKNLQYALAFISMEQEVMDGREGDIMRVQNYLRFAF